MYLQLLAICFFPYVNAILADNDYDTIIRAKFDNNQGLEANPEFNAQFAIKPAESWYYKMGEVPSNWYGSDTYGWTSGTVGISLLLLIKFNYIRELSMLLLLLIFLVL